MRYSKFQELFNEVVFAKSKAGLLKKLAKHPERYVGIFRPTTPQAKVIQNITQSNEIRFGDAFEKIIGEYLEENGYEALEKRISYEGGNLLIDQLVRESDELHDANASPADDSNYPLSQKDDDLSGAVDVSEQIVKKEKRIVFIEQKLRDDHDSTKKRGQISNFGKKLSKLLETYKRSQLSGYLYFIDPSFSKNRNYYIQELDSLSESCGIRLKLVYGSELFKDLNIEKVWHELVNHLTKWKQKLPDLPDVDFDIEADKTFQEIKDINTSTFRKLFEQRRIIEEFFPILFPQQRVLKKLQAHFLSKKQNKAYQNLANLLQEIMK